MPTAMALDLSLDTGWAVDGPTPGRPLIGTLHLPRGLVKGEYGRQFSALRAWLVEAAQVHKPDVIVFEAPLNHVAIAQSRHLITSQHQVRLLLGLAAVTEEFAATTGIEHFEETVQAVKKYWTGDSSAGKGAMIGRCYQLGWPVHNDDEADAAAMWALCKASLETTWSPVAGTPLFAGAGA